MQMSRLQAFLLLALCNLLWSGNWVAGRALRDTFDPVSLNFWRWLLATALLAPFALPALRGKWPLIRRHAGILLLLAASGVAAFHGLVYLGLRSTTTVNAVLLNSSIPLFMMLCSWIIERERATPRQVAGMLVSLAGILVILSRGEPASLLQLELHGGDLWILLAMPIWGIYSVLLKRRPPELGGLAFLFVISAAGVAMLAPAAALRRAAGAAALARRGRGTGRRLHRAGRVRARLYLLEPRRRRGRRERRRLHRAPAARVRHGARDPVPRRSLRRLPRRGDRRDPRRRADRDARYFNLENAVGCEDGAGDVGDDRPVLLALGARLQPVRRRS